MMLKAVHANCSGCGVCRLACSLANYSEVNPAKALLQIKARFPAPGDYRIEVCDQCGECAEVCPVDAIELTPDGAYQVGEATCTVCMMCVDVCPHGVVVQHDADEPPHICVLCGACAETCPRDALVFSMANEK